MQETSATKACPLGRRLPRLAIAYDDKAPSPMALAEAAAGLCDLIWVIDTVERGPPAMGGLLGKLGSVVDLDGSSLEDAAAVLADERPEGIVAFDDGPIRLVASLAARLGLPTQDAWSAERLVDKRLQRAALEAYGLAGPRCWTFRLDETEDLERLLGMARFPVVLKPRQGSGSRSTFLADDPDELERLVGEARSCLGVGVPSEMLLEEYIPDADPSSTAFADYLSAEMAVDDHQIVCLALTGRLALAEPLRESGLFVPSDLSEADATDVAELSAEALRALRARVGIFHVEVKLTPSGPQVIEVNGRAGGIVPDLLRLAGNGFSIYALAMRLALGEPLGAQGVLSFDRVAFRRLVQPPVTATVVESIDGLDELAGSPGIVEVVTNRVPGEEIDWREGTHEYVVQATGTAADHDELQAMVERVDRTVSVHYRDEATSRP